MRSLVLLFFFAISAARCGAGELKYSVRQITAGPQQHFFGYIGQVQNIPWNASGRYLVVLQTGFQDHLPKPDEPAEILLLDAKHDYAATVIEKSLAWNPQQGTMLYWNPGAPETQFFFNDRDPATGKVFTVLYDIEQKRRVHEFKYDATPFGNSGVSQSGGYFLGLNYGRLARLRPVTGYPQAFDWTKGFAAPANDGVFKADISTGTMKLLVSYDRLAETLRRRETAAEGKELFINHTLTSRDGKMVYFFVRAEFDRRRTRINVGFSMNTDGSGLVAHRTIIGGHPEWDLGTRMIGRLNNQQIIYDVIQQRVVGTIGTPELFPDPEGDIALAPDPKWFVNGYRVGSANYYAILNRESGDFVRTRAFNCEGWTTGDLRLDPAPTWNRQSNQILVPALADDATKSRQLFVISIKK